MVSAGPDGADDAGEARNALDALDGAPLPGAIGSLEEALARAADASAPFANPAARAIAAGFAADRVGYAFLGGYAAALRALVPSLGAARAALCATEAAGAHPRAIATRLDVRGAGWTVSGTKTFATLADAAEALLVVASLGLDAEGKNRLTLVRVAAAGPGVTMRARPPLAFCPEIPHAAVELVEAPVLERYPGDGYQGYLKPFRTVEDFHVFLAVTAHLFGVARRLGWGPAVDAARDHARALIALAGAPPLEPETHRALDARIDAARSWALALPWAEADAETRARWERDQGILWVAEAVRKQRRARADLGPT